VEPPLPLSPGAVEITGTKQLILRLPSGESQILFVNSCVQKKDL
jgi:hypothetical protein